MARWTRTLASSATKRGGLLMLRETKLGIVISCSFLGLLGVVVTSKLRDKPVSATSVQAAEPDVRTTALPATPDRDASPPGMRVPTDVAGSSSIPGYLDPSVKLATSREVAPHPENVKSTAP